MLKQTIYRLGSHPKRSLRYFLSGLGIFTLAAALIAIGYYHSHHFQIAGLTLLAIAFPLAIYGYLGILANRFSQLLKHKEEIDKLFP